LNGPEQKVVKISLPQIDPKARFGILDPIYNLFQADRIGENLYIKVIGFLIVILFKVVTILFTLFILFPSV
jgi:hypothetical protein